MLKKKCKRILRGSDRIARRPLTVEYLERRLLLASYPQLIGDIEAAPHGAAPSDLVRLGGKLIFAAEHGQTGRELWISDATSEGTGLLQDINAGGNSSNPSNFVVMDEFVYFTATQPASGRELWRTDGTPSGTQLVKDISSGSNSSSPEQLTVFNGKLYFSAFGPGGRELWMTDGTADGTIQVADIFIGTNSSSPQSLVVWNDSLYFSAISSGIGRELWKTDGTDEGTVLVKDISPGTSSSNPAHLVAGPNQLFFVAQTSDAGAELWTSDGTTEGTLLLKDISIGASSSLPEHLTIMNGVLYFAATNADVGRELWRSDGTPEGTYNLADILPGSSSSSNPWNLIVIDSTLYFTAVGNSIGRELWKSNGTSEGTAVVANLAGANSSDPRHLRNVAGTLFFTASTSTHGRELWKSDGTGEGTVMVADLFPGSASSDPLELMVWDDLLFFSAITAAHGRELWTSNGTFAGTQLIRDINTKTLSSSPEQFYSDGGTLYFSATTQNAGRELWKSDGPSETTVMLLDSNLGSNNGNPGTLTRYGDYLYFAANSTWVGRELWRTDGTPEGTELFKDIYGGAFSSSPTSLLVFNDLLYFVAADAAHGTELWHTDGTLAGTSLVFDVREGTASSSPNNLVVAGDTLYFTAFTDAEGRELWKSDGTAAGTSLVRDIRSGSSSSDISNITAFGDSIVFVANDGISGIELWISDGTAEGTEMLVDLQVGAGSSSPANLVVMGDHLYFAATVSGSGRELWRTNGTLAGTHLVADIVSGASSSSPEWLKSVGNVLYFSAVTGSSGRELWKSDGTALGTMLVKDIRPGNGSSSPTSLVAVGETLYFVADDGVLGAELWSSDGTLEGTQVTNLRDGLGSMPMHLFADGDRALAFTADDGSVGREAWRLMVGSSPTNVYLDNIYVAENQPIGTAVGNLHTVHPTENETFTYSLVIGEGDTDNGMFAIAGDQLVTAVSLDFETKPSYSVRIKATDGLGGTFEKRMIVRATDVNDAPQLSFIDVVQSAAINTAYVLDYDTLLASSDAQDQDGDVLSFIVQGLGFGTLTKDGEDVVLGVTTLGPGEHWVWSPPEDTTGNILAFEVVVTDGLLASTENTPVIIEVLPWTLFVAFADNQVEESGPSIATTLTIRRVGDLTTPLDVSLDIDRRELWVPTSVTIPAGQSTLTIPVLIVNDGDVDGNQTVSIVASAVYYPEGQDSIIVIDDDSLEHRTIGGALAGTLTAGTYTVIQDLNVPVNGTLVIQAGAELRFNAGRRLSVPSSATLLAIGTADALITFTSNEENPLAGDWEGIIVSTLSAPRTEIRYAEIAYATIGVRNSEYRRVLLDLANSTIRQISTHGIDLDVGYGQFLSGADARILDNKIHHIGNTGIRLIARGISGNPPSNGGNSAFIEGNEIYQTNLAIGLYSSYSAAGGFVGSASVSPTIVGNWLHDNQRGIAAVASKPSNAFGSAWAAGTIFNNQIAHNAEFGIQYERYSGQIAPQIANNTIVGNGTTGIAHALLNTDGFIRNNNVVGNGTGIRLTESATIGSTQVGFNNVWGNLTNWIQYPDSYGTASGENGYGTAVDDYNNMSEDPHFMDLVAENYRLRVTSPLIDAGTSSQTPSTDFDGQLRDENRDIGAFEKFSTPPQEIELSSSQFNENVPPGYEVAVLSSVDLDIDDVHTYSLVSGEGDDDNNHFMVSGGHLLFMGAADFETQASFTIRLRSTDLRGKTYEQILSLQVIDLPEILHVQVGDGTVQRSAVGQLKITFDGLVTIDEGAFSVSRLGAGDGNVDVAVSTSINHVGQTVATLTFSGSQTRANGLLVDGNYQLTIHGSMIHRGGLQLDGNSNGISGGDFTYGTVASDRFFAFYGDVDGDRHVGFSDFIAFRASFGRNFGDSGYRRELDFDDDGSIGFSEFIQFRSRFGQFLAF